MFSKRCFLLCLFTNTTVTTIIIMINNGRAMKTSTSNPSSKNIKPNGSGELRLLRSELALLQIPKITSSRVLL